MTKINFQLQNECWLSSDSAGLTVSVEISTAVPAFDAVSLAKKALSAVSPTEWQLKGIKKSKSKAALTEWSIQAETRIPKERVANIGQDVARVSASKEFGEGVNLAMILGQIDHTPTVAEFEKCYELLRGQIYASVRRQVTELGVKHVGTPFQIHSVDFHSMNTGAVAAVYTNSITLDNRFTVLNNAQGADPVDNLSSATKVTVTASIKLKSAVKLRPTV